MGGIKALIGGLRAFFTQLVQRHTVSLDWISPISYFFSAAISIQLNEGSNLQKRNLSTMGFRVSAKPAKKQFDYEIESICQVGAVDHTGHFAHRHHGVVGYKFYDRMGLMIRLFV